MASLKELDHSDCTKSKWQWAKAPIAIHGGHKEVKKGRSIVELEERISQFYFTMSSSRCVNNKHPKRDLSWQCMIAHPWWPPWWGHQWHDWQPFWTYNVKENGVVAIDQGMGNVNQGIPIQASFVNQWETAWLPSTWTKQGIVHDLQANTCKTSWHELYNMGQLVCKGEKMCWLAMVSLASIAISTYHFRRSSCKSTSIKLKSL